MGEIRKLTFLGDITCDRPLLEACRISRGGSTTSPRYSLR